jgi:broad specificity phosphatase PhoE
MRILLIRHGQDEHGYRGGWSQRGLTAEGFAQARALATHLRVRWQPIHLLLSSDLRRATETTEEILKVVQVPVQYMPEWREMNNGALAGMPNALAEARYPGLYASSLAMDEPYPGGESPRQYWERIRRAFDTLCEQMLMQQLPADVAVITHGGPINILYHLIKDLPWSNKNPSFATAATGIHEISYVDGAWGITVENATWHLQQG